MNEENETNPQGKAVNLELEEDFQPNELEIKKAQKFARETSHFLLELFEAEEKEE